MYFYIYKYSRDSNSDTYLCQCIHIVHISLGWDVNKEDSKLYHKHSALIHLGLWVSTF